MPSPDVTCGGVPFEYHDFPKKLLIAEVDGVWPGAGKPTEWDY